VDIILLEEKNLHLPIIALKRMGPNIHDRDPVTGF
jgi:hypothetical protein